MVQLKNKGAEVFRGQAYLAEIEGLLLLEMGAWPLLPVGNGSR